MNKKIIALVLVVLLVGGAAFAMYPVVKNHMITKDPVKYIMNSAMESGQSRNMNATISLKLELDEELAVEQGIFDGISQDPDAMAEFANALLKKLEILYDINMITDGEDDLFRMDAGLGINYDRKNIVGGKLYFNPWEFGIEIPKLSKKYMYIDMIEIMESEGIDIDFDDIDFKAYLDLIYKKDDYYKAVVKNYKPYKKVIYDYLQGRVEKLDNDTITLNIYGEESDIKVTKYKLDIDIFDIYDVYADLLEIAKDDENMKALVASRINEFKDLVIENKDYEKADLTKDEFIESMNEIEDQINNNWDEGIDTVIDELKSMTAMLDTSELENFDYDIDYIISIDNNHKIRQIEIGMQSQFIKINQVVSYNAFGDDVKCDYERKEEDRVNLFDLENNQALAQEIAMEAVNNLVPELLGGEAMEALISDIKTEAKVLPAEESDLIINNIDMMINQVYMYIPFLLQELGM